MSRQSFIIMKKFEGVGLRYLDSPERPFKWVVRPDFAYRFESSSPVETAREAEGEILEMDR